MIDIIKELRKGKNDVELTSDLELNNVTFAYSNDDIVFEEANFINNKNGLTILKGHNGSGKTTIIKLLTNFVYPQVGEVICKTKGPIGYSSANGSDINSYIKCDCFLKDCIGDNTPNLLNESLKWLNLESCRDHRIIELSSGQRKMLSLYRAFTKSDHCLLLDEPLSFLDKSFQKTIIGIIEELKDKMTILMTSHTDKFDNISDCVFEIKDKKIIRMAN